MQGCKLLLINLKTIKYLDECKKVSHKKNHAKPQGRQGKNHK